MASALTLVLISTVLCTGGVTAQRKLDTAPFTLSEASNTYQYSHHLSCPHNRNVFIRYLKKGYKRRECQCYKDCCPYLDDCLQAMSPDILQQATKECWDKSECRPLVTKAKDSCQKDGMEFQLHTYSDAVYICVPGDTVVDMAKQTWVSGAEVTVRALPAGLPHSHTVTCSVQTVGGGQHGVGVYAVLGQGVPPLSCLSVGTETLCSQGHFYTAGNESTPFSISLQQPAHSSLHYAWVFMQVLGDKIRVSCGQGETTPSPTAPAGPTTETVVGLTAGLAGLVVALAASWVIVFLVWRRRQRARGTGHGTQPDQGGHIVLAELATARPDVTYESLRAEGDYQRLALPGRVGDPPDDVISAEQEDYDDCDVVDVTGEDPTDVIGVEREGQGVEKAPYDVIEPSYVNENVD